MITNLYKTATAKPSSKRSNNYISDDAKPLDPLNISGIKLIAKHDELFSTLQIFYDPSEDAFSNEISKELFLTSMIYLKILRSEYREKVDKFVEVELSIDNSYKVNYNQLVLLKSRIFIVNSSQMNYLILIRK